MMASEAACERAIRRLVAALDSLDPEVRAKLLPPRRLSLVVTDLGLAYTAQLDETGVAGWAPAPLPAAEEAEVRFVTDSDELVAISHAPGLFPMAWLRGRVRVHAGFRDLLELRRLL